MGISHYVRKPRVQVEVIHSITYLLHPDTCCFVKTLTNAELARCQLNSIGRSFKKGILDSIAGSC